MTDPVAAIGTVSSPTAAHSFSGDTMGSIPSRPSAADVASFHALVQPPSAGTANVGSKLVDAGVGLSNRYAERLDNARELASISPDALGIDQTDYMRAMLSVQVSLGEVTAELQSTSQIANSVKDSFNSLYRMQG